MLTFFVLWSFFPCYCRTVHFLMSFRSLLKWHLFREPLPDKNYHPPPHLYALPLIFLHRIWYCVIYRISLMCCYLSSVSLLWNLSTIVTGVYVNRFCSCYLPRAWNSFGDRVNILKLFTEWMNERRPLYSSLSWPFLSLTIALHSPLASCLLAYLVVKT